MSIYVLYFAFFIVLSIVIYLEYKNNIYSKLALQNSYTTSLQKDKVFVINDSSLQMLLYPSKTV